MNETPTPQTEPPTGRAPTPEEIVINKILRRRALGLAKYGVGTERTDLTPIEWLNHAQEEAMDLAVYLERLIQSLSTWQDELSKSIK